MAAALALASIAIACTEATRDLPPTAPPTTAPAATSPRSASAPPTLVPPETTRPPIRTARPSLPAGASLPPMPSQPSLPSGATTVTSGTVTFAVAPGGAERIEAHPLALERGASPPPNAGLVWTVSWRATEPLAAAWYRQTAHVELGRGRWGTAEIGGAGFELRNDGAETVFGELSYTIGSR